MALDIHNALGYRWISFYLFVVLVDSCGSLLQQQVFCLTRMLLSVTSSWSKCVVFVCVVIMEQVCGLCVCRHHGASL